MALASRPGCYEIPATAIALHFARKRPPRPRCVACGAPVEPWLAYEADQLDGPRDRRPDLCRSCANSEDEESS